ncbi:hypothetical protein [Thalassomonas sp. RHCl1]|uniref:hypothetical protein n=1 Tax=Thalassomonas sp. RHCl1 TaxID=2995320 RepID=UPI00248AC564|nr:hypothetical protein [Thalassomonas sp. RHCl1]
MTTANLAPLPIPEEYAIHIVEKAMPVDQLIMILYDFPEQIVYDHFKLVNSHIKNDEVHPGQIVLLSPADATQCTIEEAEFLKVAEQVDLTLLQLSNSEREILARRYDLLSSIGSYSGLLLGVANSSWTAHVKQVELILKDIEETYVTSYNRQGNLNNQIFFQRRRMHFTRLDAALSRLGQPEISGRILPGDIRSNLGLSSKSTIRQWKKLGGAAETIPNFARNYEAVAKMSRNLKRVGYVGIALTGLDASLNIRIACIAGDEETCRQTKYSETGKAIANVAGGLAVGYLTTWGTCSLIFSLPSGGTSAFWCALVAGAGGGYAGGLGGGSLGEELGMILYAANAQH